MAAAAGAEEPAAAAAEEQQERRAGSEEEEEDDEDEEAGGGGDSESSGDGEDEEKENEAEIQRLEEQVGPGRAGGWRVSPPLPSPPPRHAVSMATRRNGRTVLAWGWRERAGPFPSPPRLRPTRSRGASTTARGW